MSLQQPDAPAGQIEGPARGDGDVDARLVGGVVALVAFLLLPLAAVSAAVARFVTPRLRLSAWWVLGGAVAATVVGLLAWGLPEPWVWLPQMWQELFPEQGERDIAAAVLVAGAWPVVLGWLAGAIWRVHHVRTNPEVDDPAPWTLWREHRSRRAIARTPLRNGYLTVGLDPVTMKDRVVLPESTTNTGCLVLGATGSGKTRGVVSMAFDVVASGHPLVYVDLKGSSDVPMELAGLAAKFGRPFWHFKLFDAAKEPYVGPAPSGPASYNPASTGDPTRRKDLLMAALSGGNEYYHNLASAYALTAFTVLQQAGKLEGHSALAAILEVMEPQDLLRAARSIPAGNSMRARLIADAEEEVRKAGKERDYAANLRGLRDYLSLIMNSVAGPFINGAAEDVIDFAEVDRLGGVVVFSLSDMEYANLPSQLGSLIVQDFATYAGLREKDPSIMSRPFYLVVDEFSAFGKDNVLGLLARGRSAGVHTILATQNLADLHRAGEGFREQVLGIVGSFIFFRGNTQVDCEVMSGLTGREGSPGFVPWDALQALETGQCVLVNNMPVPKQARKGLVVPRRARADVVLRDIPEVDSHTIVLRVTEDASGNWLAQAPVDASAEELFAQMKDVPSWRGPMEPASGVAVEPGPSPAVESGQGGFSVLRLGEMGSETSAEVSDVGVSPPFGPSDVEHVYEAAPERAPEPPVSPVAPLTGPQVQPVPTPPVEPSTAATEPLVVCSEGREAAGDTSESVAAPLGDLSGSTDTLEAAPPPQRRKRT